MEDEEWPCERCGTILIPLVTRTLEITKAFPIVIPKILNSPTSIIPK